MKLKDRRQLNGEHEVYLYEDSEFAAHIIIRQSADESGSFVTYNLAEEADGFPVGWSLVHFGLAALRATGHLTQTEVIDLSNELQELVEAPPTDETSPNDMVFPF